MVEKRAKLNLSPRFQVVGTLKVSPRHILNILLTDVYNGIWLAINPICSFFTGTWVDHTSLTISEAEKQVEINFDQCGPVVMKADGFKYRGSYRDCGC